MSNKQEHYAGQPVFRLPSANDADELYKLINVCKPLDLNSRYTYLLLCDHFRDTCVIAEVNDMIAGVVLGYMHPRKPNTLFVWQIAVEPNKRKRGIALCMLEQLLRRKSLKHVLYIETTIIPSNTPSIRLFRFLANKMKTKINEKSYFLAKLFGKEEHEEEILFTIGPLKAQVEVI